MFLDLLMKQEAVDYMRGLLCTLNTVQKHTTLPQKADSSMQSYIKQEKYPAQAHWIDPSTGIP